MRGSPRRTARPWTYGEVVTGEALNVEATGKATLVPASEYRYIGQSVPRMDIPAKMTGEAIFVQEIKPDGLVYGAIARPPTYEASLVEADLAAIDAMPGVIKTVRNGSFLGVIAEHQDQAWAAAEALEKAATWDVKSVLPGHDGIFDWLESAQSEELELVKTERSGGGEPAKVLERTYQRPYHMHASIGTSAAIAEMADDGGDHHPHPLAERLCDRGRDRGAARHGRGQGALHPHPGLWLLRPQHGRRRGGRRGAAGQGTSRPCGDAAIHPRP